MRQTLKKLMTQQVTVQSLTEAEDDYGNTSGGSWATTEILDAKVEVESAREDQNGRNVAFTRYRIFIDSQNIVEANNRLLFKGQPLNIDRVKVSYDWKTGRVHHQTIWSEKVY